MKVLQHPGKSTDLGFFWIGGESNFWEANASSPKPFSPDPCVIKPVLTQTLLLNCCRSARRENTHTAALLLEDEKCFLL